MGRTESVGVDAFLRVLARVAADRLELRSGVGAVECELAGVAVAARGGGGDVVAGDGLGRAAVGLLRAGVGAADVEALLAQAGLVAAAAAVRVGRARPVAGGLSPNAT